MAVPPQKGLPGTFLVVMVVSAHAEAKAEHAIRVRKIFFMKVWFRV
jgi:hypothetical protein